MMAAGRGEQPILQVHGLRKHFPMNGGLLRRQVGAVRAVDGVDFDLCRGETLGVVGESGCGKTTLGRAVVRLTDPTDGTIRFKGQDITALGRHQLRPVRRNIQFMFQNPFASLDPRMNVHDLIAEPLRVHGLYRKSGGARRVAELMDIVGLRPSYAKRYPRQFSGGQRQRIGLARALALDPEILVADEPVSALDVSVQAQVLELLADLKTRLGLSMIFVTHDLRVAAQICDQVAVMQYGRVVESGPAAQVFTAPSHEYTQALIEAIPGRHWSERVAAQAQGEPI